MIVVKNSQKKLKIIFIIFSSFKKMKKKKNLVKNSLDRVVRKSESELHVEKKSLRVVKKLKF